MVKFKNLYSYIVLTYALLNRQIIFVLVIILFSHYFISEKHPEIKELYGPDKNFKWIVIITTILQLGSFYFIKDLKWPIVIFLAYCFGGVVNHSLMLGKITFLFFFFSS